MKYIVTGTIFILFNSIIEPLIKILIIIPPKFNTVSRI